MGIAMAEDESDVIALLRGITDTITDTINTKIDALVRATEGMDERLHDMDERLKRIESHITGSTPAP